MTVGAMTAATVVRAYLVIAGMFMLSVSVIWSVNTLFLLDARLDIFEVFIANAAFTAGMVLFEIPTGVIADTSGRRRSFLLSAVTLLVGTLGYVALRPLLLLRRISEHADVIGGRRAGTRGPCAAQGLPQVASVATTARRPAVSTR
jgi:MFS family permease